MEIELDIPNDIPKFYPDKKPDITFHKDLVNIKQILSKSETTMENYRGISLSILKWKNQSINLKNPLEIEAFDKDGFWEIKNKLLDIICIARTFDKCLDEFKEEFFVLLEEYVETPDEQLTIDAIELKEKLLKLIGKK